MFILLFQRKEVAAAVPPGSYLDVCDTNWPSAESTRLAGALNR